MIETERLTLRPLSFDDDEFILELLNDSAWIEHIGDRGVRDLAGARGYIENGPMKMLAKHGFGLYLVQLMESQIKIGLCGLLKRDYLPNPDLGFAFLPAHRGQGLAYEATQGVCEYAQKTLDIRQLLAITSPKNERSGRLLTRLSFENQGLVELADYGESLLWERDLSV